PVQAALLTFSPDGKTLATGERDSSGGLRLWDIHSGRERWQTDSGDYRVTFLGAAFTPDGREVIWAREVKDRKDGRKLVIERLNAATGRPLGQSTVPQSSAVWAIFSPDCSLVAHDGGWSDYFRGTEEASFLRLLDT